MLRCFLTYPISSRASSYNLVRAPLDDVSVPQGRWAGIAAHRAWFEGLEAESDLALEGENARVRGNLISFPLPLILGAKLDFNVVGLMSQTRETLICLAK